MRDPSRQNRESLSSSQPARSWKDKKNAVSIIKCWNLNFCRPLIFFSVRSSAFIFEILQYITISTSHRSIHWGIMLSSRKGEEWCDHSFLYMHACHLSSVVATEPWNLFGLQTCTGYHTSLYPTKSISAEEFKTKTEQNGIIRTRRLISLLPSWRMVSFGN